MERNFFKKDTQRASKHGKSSTSSIREMLIKTTVRDHYMPTKMAKIKNSDNTKCW